MAIWKPVAGYEELYLVSDEGDVLSLPRIVHNSRCQYERKPKYLRPGKRGKNGKFYLFVTLTDGEKVERKSVHRIVAEAFHPNPDELPEVNHIDENPMNNAAENLEWCTRQYNIEYSKALRVSQYSLDGEKLAEYRSITVAAQMTGIGRKAINNCLGSWSKTSGGYIWKYEKEE